MSWLTPRTATELPNRQERLQAELRELQAELEAVQVLQQKRREATLLWLNLMNKRRAGPQTLDAALQEDEAHAKDLANEFKELLTDLLKRIRTTSSRIEEVEVELEDFSRPYIDRLLRHGPPSQAEKEGLFKLQICGGQPLYDCGFPADAQPPLPLTLVHPVFAEFCDDFSDDSLVLDDNVCKFVLHLCYHVLGRMGKFADEADLKQAFNLALSKFLDYRAVAMDIIGSGAKTDVVLKTAHGGQLKVLLELKLDKGSTLVQGLHTFGVYSSLVKKNIELLPCFFIEVIGPTIRIGGLVSFERVAWQPLTPFMNCFYTEHDRKDMVTLCRAMRALKKGVLALEHYYNMRAPSHTITLKDVPYPLQGKQSVRIGNRLVFIVTLNSEIQIFKYCKQYGEEVHRSWANAGVAPCLHSCKLIAGGWLEVQMEYLEDYSNAYSLLHDIDRAEKHQLRAAISDAWVQASAILVGGCLVAHGDMRPSNIMVRRDVKRGTWTIKFIDFDWAGKVGVARYPPFMNKDLPWHPNVGAGTLLDRHHDQWCVEHEGFWKLS